MSPLTKQAILITSASLRISDIKGNTEQQRYRCAVCSEGKTGVVLRKEGKPGSPPRREGSQVLPGLPWCTMEAPTANQKLPDMNMNTLSNETMMHALLIPSSFMITSDCLEKSYVMGVGKRQQCFFLQAFGK